MGTSRLNLHELIEWVTRHPGDKYVDLYSYVEGWRFGTQRKMMKTIRTIADDSWLTCDEYDLTFTITKDPYPWWKRFTHSRHHVLVVGPAFAVQIYLHTLEKLHGHRR